MRIIEKGDGPTANSARGTARQKRGSPELLLCWECRFRTIAQESRAEGALIPTQAIPIQPRQQLLDAGHRRDQGLPDPKSLSRGMLVYGPMDTAAVDRISAGGRGGPLRMTLASLTVNKVPRPPCRRQKGWQPGPDDRKSFGNRRRIAWSGGTMLEWDLTTRWKPPRRDSMRGRNDHRA